MATSTEVRIGNRVVDLAKAFPLKLKDAIALSNIGILNKDGTPVKNMTPSMEQMQKMMHHFIAKVDPEITEGDIGELELEELGTVTNAINGLMEAEGQKNPLGRGKKRN